MSDRSVRRPLYKLSSKGIETIEQARISKENVGEKAVGIASLPIEWSLPFFVIDGELATNTCLHADQAIIEGLNTLLFSYNKSDVIIRSSGSQETIRERGQLPSRVTSSDLIFSTLQSLAKEITPQVNGIVHWIVQQYVEPLVDGQLSNERRVSKEHRDWIIEANISSVSKPAASLTRVAIRPWRDGKEVSPRALDCSSFQGVSTCIRPVAMWATGSGHRIHFEWIWDGRRIYIVQMDAVLETAGVNPNELVTSIPAPLALPALNCFRVANDNDFEAFPKLRNAAIYRSLGFEMPPFYILDNQEIIRTLTQGVLSQELRHDLRNLAIAPCVIRTDGINIPDAIEMLPRSDELITALDAENWLTGQFIPAVTSDAALTHVRLALIVHHFIPATSSAWARAEPNNQSVRIESLWGIPDGLYWHAHDVFEVNCKSNAQIRIPFDPTWRFNIREKTRFKGTFIAAEASTGKWLAFSTKEPFDWQRSIRDDEWIREIAWVTRQIAELEQAPVSVMWFVETCRGHKVLPWFHSRANKELPRASPPRKWRSSSNKVIRTVADWEALKLDLSRQSSVERIEVLPSDIDLIRNKLFVEELATLAVRHNFVIVLNGGILSHAFYMLNRAGARVECNDEFLASEEIQPFYKLVRDLIPESIATGGESVSTRQLSGDALIQALKRKLVEEAIEALDSTSGEDLLLELADINEVMLALCEHLGVSREAVESERLEKRSKRGGFEMGFMLVETAGAELGDPEKQFDLTYTTTTPIRIEPLIPSKPSYRKLDERQLDSFNFEKMLVFEAEINDLGSRRENVTILSNTNSRIEGQFYVEVEQTREKATLRTTIRIRQVATQLSLFEVVADS